MKLLISTITLFILTFSSVSWAVHLRLPDRAYQGDLIVGRIEPVGTVFLKGQELPVSSKGYFAIGVPREQKTDLLITAISGKNKVSKTVRVLAYQWNTTLFQNGTKHDIASKTNRLLFYPTQLFDKRLRPPSSSMAFEE